MDDQGGLGACSCTVPIFQVLPLRPHFCGLACGSSFHGVHLPADKTGGKKFSKEFEEASSKLEEFVNGLDKQVKNGPSLTEALENAGIFYEAQYKEVKVVANVSVPFLDPPQV